MFFTLCADTATLGRFDPSMLTDQARMEILVTPIEDGAERLRANEPPLKFKDSTGEFFNACDWPGVECDNDGSVTYIDWYLENWACGAVSLDILPPNLSSFDITRGFLSSWQVRGTISTDLLPRHLDTFVVDGCAFEGSIDLTLLPPPMRAFRARDNRLEGKINLESLPAGMLRLDLSGNQLNGRLCLTQLPATMHTLALRANQFTGPIEFENLPCMQILDLRDNALYGSPSLDKIPMKFGELRLENNYFQGDSVHFMNQRIV